MKTKILILIVFCLVIVNSGHPQNWIPVDSIFQPSGIKVNNFTCPFFYDLDNDGLTDLMLGNGSTSRVRYFKNIGPKINPKFAEDTNMVASIYANGYVGTNAYYPAIHDLDGDGLADLMISGYNGIVYYRNTGTPWVPVWQKVDTVFASVNTLIGSDAKPAFADLDNDGDLDMLVGIGESLLGGPTAGITIGFRNTGSRYAPKFTQDNSLVTNIPDMGLNSYPAFADLNGDGDYDLLFGRDVASIMYYENTGTVTAPVWTRNTSLFQSVEISTYWKNPVFNDIDGDGDFDLIYGNSNGRLYFYKNTGTKTAPQFQYDASYFKIIRLNQSASTVSFADYDNDGDQDLVSGNWLGNFEYFRNDGTPNAPAFTRVDLNFAGIDAGSYSCPRFIDIDKDGDFDIVSGELNGKILCYINTPSGWMANSTIFAGINVVGFSAPGFVDIDNDGDLDLLVCAEQAANTKFYLNNGSNVFTQDNSYISGITFYRSSNPAFVDIDFDGDFDLLLGDLSFYKNAGTKLLPVWVRDDSLFDGISVRQSCTPGFADLNGDGKQDMLLGDYDGNFTYYQNNTIFVSVDDINKAPNRFFLSQNYPNPFNPSTIINYELQITNYVELKIYDMLGREIETLVNKVQQPGRYFVEWNGSDYPSGIYLYELKAGKSSEVRKMVLMK